MKKPVLSLTIISALTLGTLPAQPAAAAPADERDGSSLSSTSSDGTAGGSSSSSTSEDSSSTAAIIGGVAIGLGVIAAGAGAACWAMQQGMIPNPMPQHIPCHPPRKPQPAPAPQPAPPPPAPAPAPQPAPPPPAPAPKPAPAPPPPPAPSGKYYQNCKAVWNDLGGPIYRGQPGYAPHLDRDNDGVGCERRPNY